MDPYAAIENKTGFRVPDLYRRLRADGKCDYGTSREEWAATWRQRTLEDPPALLSALDFRWLRIDQVQSWEAPDYWLPEHVFVPFGKTGAGDSYAWYPRWTAGGEAPIVLANHDVNECVVQAPHLEGFMYLQMLEALTFVDPEDAEENGFTPDEAARAMRASIDALRPYLRQAWMADLDALVARAPRQWREKLPSIENVYVAHLDGTEFEERVSRELAFPRLDATFPHMKP